MDILLNELSLDKQFPDITEFFNNLVKIIEIFKLCEQFHFLFYKEYQLFNKHITTSVKFIDILQSREDEVRRFKSLLANILSNPPFWNDTQKHSDSDSFSFNSKSVINTSLAEAVERDKIIISFNHKEFEEEVIQISKNADNIDLTNILNKHFFLNFLYKIKKINFENYCKNFNYTNLDFTYVDAKFSFNLLDSNQENEFYNTFEMFSKMTWDEIIQSPGLEYKQYNPTKKENWFKETEYLSQNIYKFRITQTYRCFGFRKNNFFIVLRFELDHKISDKG